jgi:transcriptional regulator with XRE-family HTH domain
VSDALGLPSRLEVDWYAARYPIDGEPGASRWLVEQRGSAREVCLKSSSMLGCVAYRDDDGDWCSARLSLVAVGGSAVFAPCDPQGRRVERDAQLASRAAALDTCYAQLSDDGAAWILRQLSTEFDTRRAPAAAALAAEDADVGGLIRLARKQRGWSLRRAGTKMGFSHVYLSSVERGRVPVSRKLSAALVAHLGFNRDRLAVLTGHLPESTRPYFRRRPGASALLVTLAELDLSAEELVQVVRVAHDVWVLREARKFATASERDQPAKETPGG